MNTLLLIIITIGVTIVSLVVLTLKTSTCFLDALREIREIKKQQKKVSSNP
jgi:hypothetical protein